VLKTLEEPPAHVGVRAGHDDPRDIPAPCFAVQRFDFRPIALTPSAATLENILTEEKIAFGAGGAAKVVRAAEAASDAVAARQRHRLWATGA